MEPILIVEDEPAIADLIEMTLSPHGYLCQKAQSAEQAADLLDTGRYSAVLLDVMLPGADGFSLMDYLGANDTPVIFVTARTELEDRLRGLRAGAFCTGRIARARRRNAAPHRALRACCDGLGRFD